MTLDKLRPVANRLLAPWVRTADRFGLTPDVMTIVALLFAGLAGLVYAVAGDRPHLYLLGAVLVFLTGWFDLLDGALARKQGIASARGDLLDHVLDRYADILIVAGLAAGVGRYGLGFAAITGVLMTSYLGTQAEAVGLERVYGGLVGRADRLAVIGIVTAMAAGYPAPIWLFTLVEWVLLLLAVVGHLTALQRFSHALRTLD